MSTKTNIAAAAVVEAALQALLLIFSYATGTPVPEELRSALSVAVVPTVLYFLPENFPR